MSEMDAASIVLSIVITWIVGLAPPLIIRNVLAKRPLHKWPAIGTCAVLWIFNITLFTALGSRSKSHGALLLVAFVSYWILRKGSVPARIIQSSDIGHNGFTELMFASTGENVSAVAALLATGVSVNACDDQGKTALMYAAINNRLEIVRLLLDIGADPNIKTNSGNTAAWFAENQGFDHVFELLDRFTVKRQVVVKP